AFGRVREIDDVDQHEVYALHGMIQVELARGDAARALELAREAKAIDTVGRTTGVFAYLEHEAGSGGVDIPRDMSAATIQALDSLSFADSKPYPERIAAAQKKSGAKSGALFGRGTIDGKKLILAAIDFGFIGGSMGGAVGEAITRAAELALEERTPLLVISASGGARMQEGCVSLM